MYAPIAANASATYPPAFSSPVDAWTVPAFAARLKGGCRRCVESLDGLGECEDLAVHQAHVELVEIEQVRPLCISCLQQVGGNGTQRDSAESCCVKRRALAQVEREGAGGSHGGHGMIRPALAVGRSDCGEVSLDRASQRIAPLMATSGGMTQTQARVAANALVFGYFGALEQWYLDGGIHPIAKYVEEGMLPLRSIWSKPDEPDS